MKKTKKPEMETATEVKYCTCWLPSLGLIDGDRRVVFCSKCDLVIGCVDEQMVLAQPKHCAHENTHLEEVDYGYASYEKADWIDDLRSVVMCDDCEDILGEYTREED